MIWTLSSDTSQRAMRTAGDEPLTHYGRRVVLLAESADGLDGVFVASNCKFTVKGYPCASIDLFVWHGKSRAADAVTQAVAAMRHIFGTVTGNGFAVRVCDANTASRDAFDAVGFRVIGETDAGEVLGMTTDQMPPPSPPANCQLDLFREAC